MRPLKKLFLFFFVLLLTGVASAIVITHFYQDEIEQLALQKINQQMRAPIQVDDIDFSVIKKFPYASIELKNLLVMDVYETDTLLKVEKLFLKLNAVDVFNKSYALQELELQNGFARIVMGQDGEPNYQIWKSSKDSAQSSTINLNRVQINNVQLQYTDHKRNIDINTLAEETELKGTIEKGVFMTQINGLFQTDDLSVRKENYIRDQSLSIWLTLEASKKRTNFNGSVIVDGTALSYEGKVENGYRVNVSGKDIAIEKGLSYVPKRYLKPIEDYLMYGALDFELHVENQKNSMKKAAINADFFIENGSFESDLAWKLNNATISGFYHNGKNRSNASSNVVLQSIDCSINGEPFTGSLIYSNFNDPSIETQINTKISLSEIERWGYNIPFQDIAGKAQIWGSYKGKVGQKGKLKSAFLEAEKSFNIQLTNASLLYKPFTFFQKINGKLRLIDNDLEIDSINVQIGEESSFKFIGAIEDLLHPQKNLKIAGFMSSDWLKIHELIRSDTSAQKNTFELPKNINANVSAIIKDASFNKFHMSDFSAQLHLNQGVLKVNKVKLNSMSGEITGEVVLNQPSSDKLRMISTAKLNQINVRQLFYAFENFGQTTMRYKHLRGKTSSEIYIRSEWDLLLNPITDQLYAFMDIQINDGELIDFEPMLLMSDYISVEELKRIRFNTLENQIEVKNRSVEIPFMEIRSSAMDIAGSGTHFFDNTVDYEIEFSLNEVMGKRWRKNNKKQISEFGDIESDGVKGAVIPLKMTGLIQDPKISFNFKRAKKNIDQSLQQQKQEVNDAFKQEFNKEENSNPDLEKIPDYNNIIEWEEDDEHLF